MPSFGQHARFIDVPMGLTRCLTNLSSRNVAGFATDPGRPGLACCGACYSTLAACDAAADDEMFPRLDPVQQGGRVLLEFF
jgi:hypothetical protein